MQAILQFFDLNVYDLQYNESVAIFQKRPVLYVQTCWYQVPPQNGILRGEFQICTELPRYVDFVGTSAPDITIGWSES